MAEELILLKVNLVKKKVSMIMIYTVETYHLFWSFKGCGTTWHTSGDTSII